MGSGANEERVVSKKSPTVRTFHLRTQEKVTPFNANRTHYLFIAHRTYLGIGIGSIMNVAFYFICLFIQK